jgi:hypothetical protein
MAQGILLAESSTTTKQCRRRSHYRVFHEQKLRWSKPISMASYSHPIDPRLGTISVFLLWKEYKIGEVCPGWGSPEKFIC